MWRTSAVASTLAYFIQYDKKNMNFLQQLSKHKLGELAAGGLVSGPFTWRLEGWRPCPHPVCLEFVFVFVYSVSV